MAVAVLEAVQEAVPEAVPETEEVEAAVQSSTVFEGSYIRQGRAISVGTSSTATVSVEAFVILKRQRKENQEIYSVRTREILETSTNCRCSTLHSCECLLLFYWNSLGCIY